MQQWHRCGAAAGVPYPEVHVRQEGTYVTTISEPAGCGNAPRQLIIRNLTVALAERNQQQLTSLVDADVQWDIMGSATIDGLKNLIGDLAGQDRIDHIEIRSVLTHGREGSIDGIYTLHNRSTLAFSHVLRFASAGRTAKVTKARSYLILLGHEGRKATHIAGQ
jgi:hypothetical protein